MTRIYILFILTLFSSCKSILVYTYGVRQPKIENNQSLNKFLNKYNIYTNDIHVAADSVVFKELIKGGVPEAYFFDSKGVYIQYREETESCNANVTRFIDTLKTANNYPIYTDKHSNLHLDTFITKIVRLPDLNPIELNENFDYTIVFTWTKYIGKVSTNHLIEWQNAVTTAQERGIKIRPIYLNLDYMEHFGMMKDDLPEFDYK